MSVGFDVVVVGAGMGGLGAALRLSEAGARVLVLERLTYPGGCAGTFRRGLFTYDAGATLASGLGPGGFFTRWFEANGVELPEVSLLDPVITFRTPTGALALSRDRAALAQDLSRAFGVPEGPLRAFLDLQRGVADLLWERLEDPELLPPFDWTDLRQLRDLPRAVPLVSLVGRPLEVALARFGLHEHRPLRVLLDALCQITVQTDVAQAEAPLALAAMDYVFRGVGHHSGGMGELPRAMVRAVEARGGEVRLGTSVRSIRPQGSLYALETRGGTLEVPSVLANTLPQALARLLGAAAPPSLGHLGQQVEDGWTAMVLYLAVPDHEGLGEAPFHLQIVQDPGAPLIEGNHLFCSVSGRREERGPPGWRTATVSTHAVPAKTLGRTAEEQAAYAREVQGRLRTGLQAFAPEVVPRGVHIMTGSPRTFERYTARPGGLVGGVPRRASLAHYELGGPRPVLPGLYLVGDSVFPGQSAMATAVGGRRVADALASPWGRERRAG